MVTLTPTRDQLTEERDSELWKALDNKDLYKVLGVASDASPKDIEKAFRRKSRDCHPDKHTDDLSTERFKELSNARELLLDPGRRWWYDYRREKEAEVIASALEGAKLRAKATQEEDRHSRELAADEEKRRQEIAVEREKLAKFVEQARARACVLSLEVDQEGCSSDEDATSKPKQLRASAPEFVPGSGLWASATPGAPSTEAAPGFAGASAAPLEDRIVEIYSISAQRWCLGFVTGIDPLPGGRAAITVQYQVIEGRWHEKMLYDHDPNLRKQTSADDVEKTGSADLWNQWKAQQDPSFMPASGMPPPPVWQGMQPFGPPLRMAPPRQLQVTVPPGCRGGQHINVVTDAGRPLTVQVPPGLMPGQIFFCTEAPLGTPQGWQPGPAMPGPRPPWMQPGVGLQSPTMPPLGPRQQKPGRTSDDGRCAIL